MQRRNLIFTIEIGVRELLPKCLLALHCRQKGFRIYFGSFSGIDLLRQRLSRSIFFHKSTWTKNALRNKSDFGSTNVFLDEEMGPAVPRGLRPKRCEARYSEVNSERYEKIFVMGPKYHDILSNLPSCKGVDIHDSGWPRIDLWRPAFGKLYDSTVSELQRNYGDYLLFPTTFGNTTEDGFQKRIEITKAYGTESTQTLRRDAFYQHLEMLPELSKQLSPSMKLVLRPHPTESVSHWRELLAGCDNVHVVREGEVTPWLLGAKGVLNFGSTTALHAAFNGVPVISYRVPENHPATDTVVFDAATHVNTLDGLVETLMTKQKEPSEKIRQKAVEMVKDDVTALEGPLASERIAEVLDQIESIRETEAPVIPWTSRLSYNLQRAKHRRRHSARWKREGLTQRVKGSEYYKLPDGLNAAEIEQNMRSLGEICGIDCTGLSCRQLSKGLVLVE